MILAIAGTKGGIGKSTLAANLAVEAMEFGLRTLVVDADPQASCMRWAQCAHTRGVRVPTVTAVGEGFYKDDHLANLARGFELTVLDCPPRVGTGLKGALMVADLVVVPCRASHVDVWGLQDTVELIREARKVRRSPLDAVVVLSGVKPRTTMGKSVREAIAVLGLPILATEVCDRADYQSVLGGGVTLRKHSARGEALREMRALFSELREEHHVGAQAGAH